MYNKYMDTLFDRDMSSNSMNRNGMQEDVSFQSMSQLNMQQPMPSGYFNQPANEAYMQQPFQRSMMEHSNSYEMPMLQANQMQERNHKGPHHKVGDIFEYHVKQGDNLYGIARVFDSNVDMIRCMNNIHDENIIKPGQRLLIPFLFDEKKGTQRQNYGLYF